MTGRKLRTTLAVAGIVMIAGFIWVNRARFTPLDVGSRAPDYTVLTLHGEEVDLSSYQGDVVLLNLWATWCAPCVREMPALQRLHEELGDDGLRIVAVSVDGPASALNPLGQFGSDVRAFIERFGLTFTVLHDPTGKIQRVYQSRGLPTTYIIDRTGRIQRKEYGAKAWDEPAFADHIRSLLGA
jgi:cytochrome c biogenesis protein CcmG/thiol:disulfide interchange protein DsbE